MEWNGMEGVGGNGGGVRIGCNLKCLRGLKRGLLGWVHRWEWVFTVDGN